MSSTTLTKLDNRLLLYFYITGVIEGFLILWLLISLPSGPSNLWLFGYSKFRIGMMTAMGAIILGFSYLTFNSLNRYPLTKNISLTFGKIIALTGYFAPLICVFFILAVLYPYYKILGLKPDYVVHEYVILEKTLTLYFLSYNQAISIFNHQYWSYFRQDSKTKLVGKLQNRAWLSFCSHSRGH